MNAERLILFILLSLTTFSCTNDSKSLPDKSELIDESTPKLPIDGLYKMSSALKEGAEEVFGVIGNDDYIRFEKGVAYYEDRGVWGNKPGQTPGRVFIKDIKKINSNRYEATFLTQKTALVDARKFDVKILVDGNNLKTTIPVFENSTASATLTFEFVE